MGETNRSLLISNPPLDPKPRFIDIKEVLTIVRESHPAEKHTFEDGRFASLNLGASGQFFSSQTFSFSPAAGFYIGGGFRMHPAIDVGGEFHYIPLLSDPGFSISDNNTQLRGYRLAASKIGREDLRKWLPRKAEIHRAGWIAGGQ